MGIFEIECQGSYRKERAGTLVLERGNVKTPVFMPVGTQGVVKLLTADEVERMGYSLILSNTYHLYLRPGEEVLRGYGGLHEFSGWKKNLLTDSGGYQVFSLGGLVRVLEDGVEFKSHIDGRKHQWGPRKVLEVQSIIGSQIKMPLDICSGFGDRYELVREFGDLTLRWARESKEYFDKKEKGHLFGIIQGGFYFDLRQRSLEVLLDLDFEGYAIGGLSIGEGKRVMNRTIDFVTDRLPVEKPRYVMGLGKPVDLLIGVELGVDMFDSVYPTRVARNATVFTKQRILSLKNLEHRMDERPIEEGCGCYTCQTYSRGYLRHLFKSKEILGMRLASCHNLYFLRCWMDRIREAIVEDRFRDLKQELKEEGMLVGDLDR